MKKPKNFNLTKIISSVVLILFILFLVNYVKKTIKSEISTVLPIDFEYKEFLSSQGVLIKNEKLYFSETDGEIYGIIDEGTRVPVGIEIAKIISSNDMTYYKNELDSIESLISFTNITIPNMNINSKEEITDILVEKIQSDIQNEVFDSIKSIKKKIYVTSENENQPLSPDDLKSLNNQLLLEKRNNILKEISNYNESILSEHSGILSYKIDSLEAPLNSLDIDSASEYIFDSNIRSLDVNNEANRAKFKIINGHEYHIAIKLSKYDFPLINDKDNIEIDLINLVDTKVNFNLPVVAKYSRGSEYILFLKGNELLEKIYSQRLLNIDIVTLKKDSFKIPIESIIVNDGIKGVFIRSFYDVVVFRPIIVNAKDPKYAYVSKGDANSKIKIGDKEHKTINEFSEIIKNPNLVIEGQIIN